MNFIDNSNRNKNVIQTTLKSKLFFSGVGIHNGKAVSMSIEPADPNTGIVFERTDVKEYNIIKAIIDLLIENEDKQIMILCHNRSLLTYLYESIIEQNIASVGYYVGGMKPIKLQETETKQIVLATYAMAAEALDIKTLSTLVMVTPKTDITQSVGRILRVKNNNPIIVDIIDTHSIFQNQWTQRKKFYKKCNYSIRQVDSSKYTNMSIDWYTDLTWKRVFDPKQTNTEIIHKSNNNDDDNDDNDDNINNSKCLIDTALFDI